MTTTTAVPSSDVSDFLFNVQKLDEAVTGSALTYIDRLGVTRLTAAGAMARFAALNPRGAWAASTLYQPRDLVLDSGTWYIALDTHTSGATFAGDLAAHWRPEQGVTRADLASTASATDALSMVAYDPAVHNQRAAAFFNYTFGRTDAEIAASVTPSNYAYFPGDPRRYGAVGDWNGATGTDDSDALQRWLDVGGQLTLPALGFRVTKRLNANSHTRIEGINRETSILAYSGSSTITNGAIIKWANKSSFSINNVGFRFTNSVIGNLSKAIHIEDCVYFNVSNVGIGGGTTASGQSSIGGILIDQTTSGFVPPRGDGTLRNILYVVEPPDSGSASSYAIWVKGHASQPMNHIIFDGDGNLEHGHYGIRLENVSNCVVGSWQFRGSTNTELALINATGTVVYGGQFAPPATTGIGISLDSGCFDNTIINPGWNFSSGTPAFAISDSGNRTVILAQSAVGALTPKNKLNGPYQFRKADGIGPSAEVIRTTTDSEAGLVLRADVSPIANAWVAINRGNKATEDILRIEGGATLFERVDVDGQRYIKAPNAAPANASLHAGSVTFYLDQAANNLKVKVKYSDGTVKIGTLAVV